MTSQHDLPVGNYLQLELHVPDFKKVKDFYGKLGFKVAWERKPDRNKGYLILEMENTILCFWSGNDYVYKQNYFKQFPKYTKRGYGVEIVVMTKRLESVYEVCKKLTCVVEKMRLQPWGLKDFRIEDPFGYYLRITELHNINILGPENAVK